MPEPPTFGVNGHVVSSPELQASMSMLSFAPAARTFGCDASTASAGSFCLFCEKTASLLATVTSRSPPCVARAPGIEAISAHVEMATTTDNRVVARFRKSFMDPPLIPLPLASGTIRPLGAGRKEKR